MRRTARNGTVVLLEDISVCGHLNHSGVFPWPSGGSGPLTYGARGHRSRSRASTSRPARRQTKLFPASVNLSGATSPALPCVRSESRVCPPVSSLGIPGIPFSPTTCWAGPPNWAFSFCLRFFPPSSWPLRSLAWPPAPLPKSMTVFSHTWRSWSRLLPWRLFCRLSMRPRSFDHREDHRWFGRRAVVRFCRVLGDSG